jgi:hypothetical protein
MRILFVCGSLQPGKDGVGDYSMRLSDSLSKSGHPSACLAINDRFVSKKQCLSQKLAQINDHQLDTEVSFRFSAQASWIKRIQAVKSLIHSWQPDWISLQFVPYAFSSYGIPLLFTLLLRQLKGEWQWHIMFHELWLGRGTNIRDSMLSICQELLVKNIISTLRPSINQTTIFRYVDLLATSNIKASILPLHSNIPVAEINETFNEDSNIWTFVFFGSIDDQWQTEPFFTYIEQARLQRRISICRFIHIGHTNVHGKLKWASISSSYVKNRYPAFQFFALGPLDSLSVSRFLSRADFGVSMAPLQWIGKSGSVAAMIEHGLPVIVPHYKIHYKLPHLRTVFDHQLILVDDQLPCKLECVTKFPVVDSLSRSNKLLLQSLHRLTASVETS